MSASITAEQRLAWLVKRTSYLEHSDANGAPCHKVPKGCYWPQSMDPTLNPVETAIEDMAGLDLIQYIDAQITAEGASC